MRHLRFVLPSVIAFLFLAASASADVRLGFNDRWDTNWDQSQRIHEVGGTEARVFITVTPALKAPNAYWAGVRREVRGLLARDVQPYFVLADVPSYGGTNSYDPADWAQTARALIARYPGYPVEIGNEPNIVPYGAVSAATFATVFRVTRAAILALRPGTTIISAAPAGMSSTTARTWMTQFRYLTRDLSYKVAMHLYGVVDGDKEIYWFFRNLYPAKPARDFWITEFGVSANGGEDRQAWILSTVLRYLAAQGTEQVTIHSFYNHVCSQGWGIVRCDGSPRPAYFAIRDAMATINASSSTAAWKQRHERISAHCHARIRHHSHHRHKRTRRERYLRCIKRLL